MPQRPRHLYLADNIMTASPERLVTLLYDGLVADLGRAGAAIAAKDAYATHTALVRAQAIVLELQKSLKPELWDGGPGLLALYHYLYRRLVRANLEKDATIVAECLKLVEPLQRTWHEAAIRCAAERAAAPAVVGA